MPTRRTGSSGPPERSGTPYSSLGSGAATRHHARTAVSSLAKLVTGSRTRASLRSLEIRHMPRAAAACPAIIDNAYVQSAEREKVELVLRLTAIAVTGELSCIACRAFATRCSACSAELYAVLLSLNAPLFQLYAGKVVHVQYSLPVMYTC